jgi:hypothetical protein
MIEQPVITKKWAMTMRDYFSLNPAPIEKRPSYLKAFSFGVFMTVIIALSLLGLVKYGKFILPNIPNIQFGLIQDYITASIFLLSAGIGSGYSFCRYQNMKRLDIKNYLIQSNQLLENKKEEIIKKFPINHLLKENIKEYEKNYQLQVENDSLKKELKTFQQQLSRQERDNPATLFAKDSLHQSSRTDHNPVDNNPIPPINIKSK